MQEASSISAIGYAWMIMHTQRRMLETHRHSSLLQRTFRRHIQAQKACVLHFEQWIRVFYIKRFANAHMHHASAHIIGKPQRHPKNK